MDIYDYFMSQTLINKSVLVFYALFAYMIVVWILMRPTEMLADKVYDMLEARRLRKDKEINARVDEYLANHAKRKAQERASSSTCVEHLALNQKVPGSNPGGLTILGNEDFDVKRRITWYLEERTAIALSDGDTSPTKFRWADLPRPEVKEFGMSSPSDTRPRIRDFREEENKVLLLWDGIQTDEFKNEVILKQFIIRLTYGIPNEHLVPSELLADANLVYETGDWVDVWGCLDKNDEIIECPREIFRPAGRNIQIMRGDRLHQSGPQFVRPAPKPRIHAFVDRREIPARIEIPDEKCFYSFRAGGFYEKGQKPLEETCEKGEKAV